MFFIFGDDALDTSWLCETSFARKFKGDTHPFRSSGIHSTVLRGNNGLLTSSSNKRKFHGNSDNNLPNFVGKIFVNEQQSFHVISRRILLLKFLLANSPKKAGLVIKASAPSSSITDGSSFVTKSRFLFKYQSLSFLVF